MCVLGNALKASEKAEKREGKRSEHIWDDDDDGLEGEEECNLWTKVSKDSLRRGVSVRDQTLDGSGGRAQVQDWVQSIFAREDTQKCFNGIHELFNAIHIGVLHKGTFQEVVRNQHYTWDAVN